MRGDQYWQQSLLPQTVRSSTSVPRCQKSVQYNLDKNWSNKLNRITNQHHPKCVRDRLEQQEHRCRGQPLVTRHHYAPQLPISLLLLHNKEGEFACRSTTSSLLAVLAPQWGKCPPLTSGQWKLFTPPITHLIIIWSDCTGSCRLLAISACILTVECTYI